MKAFNQIQIEQFQLWLKNFNLVPKNLDLYITALTHTSVFNECKKSYQKLEFLGDAVIDLAVSLYLYNVYKDAGEGIMTHIRASLVTQTTLSLVCKKIKLHDFLMIGKSELLNPHTNKNNFFADIFESFIGALYLDLGFDVVYNFLEIYLFSLLLKEDNLFFDYKTKLEEYMQQHKLHKLLYKIKAIIVDKEHFDTLIEVEAFYKNIKVGSATANKRKIAEQILAKDILDKCEKNQNFWNNI